MRDLRRGDDLAGLKRDFREVNVLLIEMPEEVQERLNTLSPWFRLLDRFGGGADELLAHLGMEGAREGAWLAAHRLAALEAAEQAAVIDGMTTALGKALLWRGPWLACLGLVVRLGERQSVAEVISVLAGPGG